MLSSLFFTCMLCAVATFAFETQEHSYVPPEGYVPNEETAIRIAEAVWIPIYGKEKIEGEKPFRARLQDGVWTVVGTLPRRKNGRRTAGGVAIAEIAKRDGRVLRVSHGK